MFTIPKHSAAQRLPSAPLDDHVRSALRQRWQGDDAHDETVKQFLRDCHERGRWIQCDCTADTLTTARPLLAVRQTETTITLARMTGADRLRHAEACIFNSGALDMSSRGDAAFVDSDMSPQARSAHRRETAPRNLNAPAKPPAFYTDSDALELAAQESDAEIRRERAEDREPTAESSRIGRRLLYLADGAWLNRLQRSTNHPAQFRPVLDFCKSVPIPKGGTLFNVIQARPRAFGEGYLARCVTEAANRGLGGTCWWICAIAGFDPDRGVILPTDDGDPAIAPVTGHIRFFGGKIESAVTRFPALMLARCDASGILDAYAHPILSVNRWCLIDSNLEREVMSDIAATLPTLCDAAGIDVVIQKPLYVWADTDERPDIVLTATLAGAEHHLVIEVMGFVDQAYLERKTEMSARVRAVPRCTFVLDWRAHDDQQFDDHIERLIRHWLQWLPA